MVLGTAQECWTAFQTRDTGLHKQKLFSHAMDSIWPSRKPLQESCI